MNNAWAFTEEYRQVGQIMEFQSLWGETTCRVWLPGRDSLVRIPETRLQPTERAGTTSRDDVARIGLPEVRNRRLNRLAQEERSFQDQLDRKSRVYPEMVPLLVVRVEGSINV